MRMTFGSLFAGIGGFDLGLERAGMTCRWQVENDPFCNKVLAKHWPDVKRYGDIRNVGKHNLESVDLICGGFPCQPFSVAGKRRGKEDDRWLWPEMLRVIAEAKPTWIIGENVAGIVCMELDKVLSDLEDQGYETQPFIIPACAVDAPHRRDRVWIMAYTAEQRKRRRRIQRSCEDQTTIKKWTSNKFAGSSKNVADANDPRQKNYQGSSQAKGINGNGTIDGHCRPSREYAKWSPEPDVGGTSDGFPVWLYRHCGRGLSYAESQRRTKILQELWNNNVSQALWKVIGGFNRIQKAEILFSFVCQYETCPDKTRIFLESKEALKEFVRGLWEQGKITGSSYRSENRKKLQEEYSDSMQTLSRLLAFNGEENWQISDWEDAIPRIATGIPRRVDRLRALGNAVVPQIVEIIGRFIVKIEDQI